MPMFLRDRVSPKFNILPFMCVSVCVYVVHSCTCMYACGRTNHTCVWGGLRNLHFSLHSLLCGLNMSPGESLRVTNIHHPLKLGLQVEATTIVPPL